MTQESARPDPGKIDGLRDSLGEILARAESAEATVREIRASRSYRAMSVIARVSARVAPRGSRRRRIGANAARAGLGASRKTLGRMTASHKGRITLNLPEQPVVSVVIPVHGKWRYTRACLVALSATSSTVPFEVIVVDDKSPDATLARLRHAHDVRVVALAKNQGYVGACNAGISAAKGEYVVLLNNDTRVRPTWLDPLLERMQDPSIGLVGAQLIYPDGTLQDAGGIVFSDGSAHNYGKNRPAHIHAFTYARDADYVSGACTMIRRATLEKLGGGLDTLFAPAYYDDTDLAFAVRELGLRVVYEPRSIVVHDEGVSHGTDETKGVKRYQAINQQRFVEKWAHRLPEQCDPSPAVVEFAARRRNGERIVVVIDDCLPTPDIDSGSVRRLASLLALRKLGYSVIFVPADRNPTEPHTSNLQKAGIEVYYGHGDLLETLASLAGHVEAIIVARVSVALERIFALRDNLPDVPIIFDTVDLHYLRVQRERETRGLDAASPATNYLRDVEWAVARACDLTLVVSDSERDLLARELPDVDVALLSNVHALQATAASTHGREGLVFVGSFAHQPNTDAVHYYITEVHPLVEAELGPYQVTIVGRGAPERITRLANDTVVFAGWVPDLAPIYGASRIAIAPLRFGAGVKGKIGEAMSYGLPVVTTPVGAEGMGLVHGENAWVGADAQEFTRGIVELVRTDQLWQTLSSNGLTHVQGLFGQERFENDLRSALEWVRRT